MAYKSFLRYVITFLKSKTKEPRKLSSSGIRGGKFISVDNFAAQSRASFGNQSILNLGVRDTGLQSSLLKNVSFSHDFALFGS